jgi:hypothetical protein
MIRVVHPGSGFFTHPGTPGKKGTGSTDPQHCILCTHSQVSFNIMRVGSLGNTVCLVFG